MKTTHKLFSILAMAVSALAFIKPAQAQVTINGTGNPDGSYTTTGGTGGMPEIYIRAKNRDTGAINQISPGVYQYAAGVSAFNANRALWNVDFGIDTTASGMDLTHYVAFLKTDIDPGTGVTYLTTPLSLITDNSFGTDSIANGGGTVSASVIPGDTVEQNSENYKFAAFGGPTFDPNANGDYMQELVLYKSTDLTFSNPEIVQEEVIVGTGAPLGAVPEPSTYGMFGAAGLIGIALLKKKLALKIIAA